MAYDRFQGWTSAHHLSYARCCICVLWSPSKSKVPQPGRSSPPPPKWQGPKQQQATRVKSLLRASFLSMSFHPRFRVTCNPKHLTGYSRRSQGCRVSSGSLLRSMPSFARSWTADLSGYIQLKTTSFVVEGPNIMLYMLNTSKYRQQQFTQCPLLFCALPYPE